MKRRRLPVLTFPPMRCDKGCGACCGVVPVTRREARDVLAYAKAHGISPMPRGSGCPLYQGGTCKVYPVRPRICQAFGHSWKLECPHGYNENLDDADVRRWITQGGMPTTTLHELFGLPVPHEALLRAAGLAGTR